MVEAYLQQGALAHLHLSARAVEDLGESGIGLSERTPRAQIAIRGAASDRFFVDGFAAATGLALPLVALGTASGLGRRVLWLGPDEWLLTSMEEGARDLLASLSETLAGRHHALTDVSDSRAVIRIEGPCLGALMSKVTSLDLDRLEPGQCARSTLARTHMLLHALPEAYEIYVHRSVADYAWRWLEDAALEFGVTVLS